MHAVVFKRGCKMNQTMLPKFSAIMRDVFVISGRRGVVGAFDQLQGIAHVGDEAVLTGRMIRIEAIEAIRSYELGKDTVALQLNEADADFLRGHIGQRITFTRGA